MEPVATQRLPYRPPYDWAAIGRFLAARTTPGVERVDERGYARTIRIGDQKRWISVAPADDDGHALILKVHVADSRDVPEIVQRVGRMFDLDADPSAIATLANDPLLRRAIAAYPGIRLPGAWDPFELTVRAIVGQQISVRGATTITGRIASRWGNRVEAADGLTHSFPTSDPLVDAAFEDCGLTRARSETLRSVARAVAAGDLRFDDPGSLDVLRSIAGIGDWTAQYVAMRALRQRDAFPSGDLILRRMAGDVSAKELERRSQAWRPWRAYAVMLLWQEASATMGSGPK